MKDLERFSRALDDRYAIGPEIGSGGMATVYLAEDLRHHRKVAVKVLDPDLGSAIGPERFLREIETAANLNHPHILPLHDSGEADGFLYYVMPFVGGESLGALLERERQLPVDDAVRYTREIADALAYANDEGVIHRDVKPANILLEAGHAVLMDFGIAQAAAGAVDTRLTRPGVSLGTAAYMSPEQVAGDGDLDSRTDQYALACVFYEMLMGEPPFTGVTATQILARKLSEQPSRISSLRSSVAPAFDEIIGRALEITPADRFPSMREFNAALLDASSTAASSRVTQSASAPQKRRLTVRWVASTLTLAVMVLVGGFLFLGSTNDLGFQHRDWIVISDFQNNTGEAVFDRSLNNALAVGLQQSNHVNLFPKTRVAQTLERMVREDTGVLTEALGREVALRENIGLLVVPSIDRIDQTFVIALRIVDPATGDDLHSLSEHAEGASGVLPALDQLARKFRRDLGESRFSISRQSVPLGAATTPSLEALEAWSEADFHWGLRNYDLAMALFQRALELDSSFAMAHAGLGGVFYFHGDRANGDRHTEKALSLTDRVTERERLWILAEIENWRQNYQGAIEAYNIYLTRFPDDLNGWFRLGYAQMREGRTADAALAFESVVEMDGENAAAFINLATCLNGLNQREEAVQQYLKAFELSPEWLTSGNLNHEFGFNYVELGAFDEAEAVFRKMLEGSDDQPAMGNRSLALMKMYLGRYQEAREHLREAAFLRQTLDESLSEMRDRLYLAVALFASDSVVSARKELGAVKQLATSATVAPNWLASIGKVQARNGLIAEAEETLEEAIQRSDETIQMDRAAVEVLRGEVALAKGYAHEAVDHLRTAYALREQADYLESLAYGLYMSGDLDAAVGRYLSFLEQPALGWEAQDSWVLSHFQLAQIYEELGQLNNARRFYQTFLEIWEGGDPDLVAANEARERLAQLGAGG